jgi:uroporphyrinogen III methyltransferase/synthase
VSTKIAAFRPENMLPRTKELAARYGFDFFGFSLFELVAREAAVQEIAAVFEDGVDIVVFTSVNGVRKTFALCEGKIDLKRRFSNAEVPVAVCAIGPATKAELEAKGLNVDVMPAEYSAEGLKRLFDELGVNGKSIAFFRSSEGGKEITDFLAANGASVTDIAVYTVKERAPTELKELFDALVAYTPDYLIFTSSLTFTILFTAAKALGRAQELFEGVKIAAIGDLTAETIIKTGLNVDLVAGKSTFEAVLIELKTELRGE